MRLPDILCFSEGNIYSINRYEAIINELKFFSSVISVWGEVFKFNITGILIVGTTPVVVFPKNYSIPDTYDSKRVEASVLLRVLLRYQFEHPSRLEEQDLFLGNDENHNSRIISAIFLIEDYQKYGYLNRKVDLSSAYRTGYIDWPATINKTFPYISHKRPVYLSPIMRSAVIDPSNIIRSIHKFVIADCTRLWGWILGCSPIDHLDPLPCSLSEAISILEMELTRTFVQRDVNVIKNMIEYLSYTTGENRSHNLEILATPYFYWVWEAICGYIFDNQYGSLKSIIPQPVWESKAIKANITQRPDILFVENNDFYILDAKYYNYHLSLPGWSDVVKQMFYKYTIEKQLHSLLGRRLIGEIKNINNIFILPEDSERDITYLGYVHVKEVDQLGKIDAFAINTKRAMKAYATRNKADFRSLLINEFHILAM